MRTAGPSRLLAALLVLAVVAACALLLGASQVTERTVERTRTWHAALEEGEVRMTLSHLWLEESLTGDTSIDLPRQVFANLDFVASACNALLNGGTLPSVGAVARVSDPRVRPALVSACRQIGPLRASTVARLAAQTGSGSRPGSRTDQEYDARFEAALAGLEASVREVVKAAERNSRRLLALNIGAVALLLALFTATGLILRSRERQRERLRLRQEAILDTSHEAFVNIDTEGRVVDWNRAAEETFGWRREEALGRPLSGLIMPERYRDLHEQGLRRYLTTGETRVIGKRIQLEGLRRDGSEIPVELTISPIRDASGELSFAAFLHDIVDRQRAEHHRELRVVLARVLGTASTLEDAAPDVLATIGSGGGWDYGGLWVAGDGGGMRCAATWSSGGEAAQRFAAVSEGMSLEAGKGIPAVARDRGPAWIPDVATDPSISRAEAAARAGLHGAAVLPLMVDGQMVGVLEFLESSAREEPAPGLMETMADQADSVAVFIERQRAAESLRRHAEDIEAATAAVRQLSRSNEAASMRPAICAAVLEVSGASIVLLHEPAPDGRALTQTAAAGAPLSPVRLEFVGPASGSVKAFMSGEPLFVADLVGDPRVNQALVTATGAVSGFWQPIVADGTPIAVLALLWDERIPVLPARLASIMNLLAEEMLVAIQRADLLSRLESVARTDDLTGLLNRRAWNEELPRELSRALRNDHDVCVGILDLDHFKLYNDTHGHQAGDRLLKVAAAAWGERLRSIDVLARYGGEEFAVVLGTDMAHAHATLERLREGTPGGQTVSIGLAQWDRREAPDALVARADAALYAAKDAGRNRVVEAAQVSAAKADADG